MRRVAEAVVVDLAALPMVVPTRLLASLRFRLLVAWPHKRSRTAVMELGVREFGSTGTVKFGQCEIRPV